MLDCSDHDFLFTSHFNVFAPERVSPPHPPPNASLKWSLGGASPSTQYTDGVQVTFYFILVSMFACAHMPMCGHLYTQGGQRITLNVIPRVPPTFFFEIGSLTRT